MKRLLLIVLPLLMIVGCSKPKDVITLRFNSYGLAFDYKNTKKVPFSGKVYKQKLGRKISEGKYKDGMIFGTWKFYDDNGNKIKEIDYKIFEGLEDNFWFYNGEQTIKDGEKVLSKYSYYLDEQQHKIKDGNYINFYEETKTPHFSGNYKNNIPVGVWSDWYMNNPTQRFSQYPLNQYGRVDGTQITWEIDGLIMKKDVYEDGKQVGESIFMARYNEGEDIICSPSGAKSFAEKRAENSLSRIHNIRGLNMKRIKSMGYYSDYGYLIEGTNNYGGVTSITILISCSNGKYSVDFVEAL